MGEDGAIRLFFIKKKTPEGAGGGVGWMGDEGGGQERARRVNGVHNPPHWMSFAQDHTATKLNQIKIKKLFNKKNFKLEGGGSEDAKTVGAWKVWGGGTWVCPLSSDVNTNARITVHSPLPQEDW